MILAEDVSADEVRLIFVAVVMFMKMIIIPILLYQNISLRDGWLNGYSRHIALYACTKKMVSIISELSIYGNENDTV